MYRAMLVFRKVEHRLLCDSLCHFFASLCLSLAVCIVDTALRVGECTSRKTREENLNQLETAELGCEVGLGLSLYGMYACMSKHDVHACEGCYSKISNAKDILEYVLHFT